MDFATPSTVRSLRPTHSASRSRSSILITASCCAIVAQLLAADHCAAQTHEVDLQRALLAHWPVVEAPFKVAAGDAPRFGTGEFSLAMWMQSDEVADRLSGDLVSQYDPACRRGFHLTLNSNPGVTTNQANWRHLQFGIDDDRVSPWRDCGRSGNALIAFALTVHEGILYAGTCEPGKNESGRVYRYDSAGNQWLDCGAPDASNAVMALAEHQGHLYAGTGKYRLAGSALPESENPTLGGRVFRSHRYSRHHLSRLHLAATDAIVTRISTAQSTACVQAERARGGDRCPAARDRCLAPMPTPADTGRSQPSEPHAAVVPLPRANRCSPFSMPRRGAC